MQWWSSASTSRTSTLCLLKNFPQAQQAAEVRHCLLLLGLRSKRAWASDILALGFPAVCPAFLTSACAHRPQLWLKITAQAEIVHAIITAWHTSAIPQLLPACTPSPCASLHSQSSLSNSPGTLLWALPKVTTAFSLGWPCSEKFSRGISLWQLSFPAQ